MDTQFINTIFPRLCVIFALFFNCADVWPEDVEESEEQFKAQNLAERTLNGGRKLIGNSYLSLTSVIDNFFAGEEVDQDENESYLKFISQGTWFDEGPEEYDNKFKAKLHLPGVQKRFRLFLDSNLLENNSLQERNRSVSTGEKIKEERSVAGLEYSSSDSSGKWKKSLRVGAKLNKRLNTFIRLRFKKEWRLFDFWKSYYQQDLWYLDGVGWGETSRWRLTRPVGERVWLQLLNELEFKDEEVAYEYAHIWQLEHRLNERYGLNYRIGLVGEGHESANYFTNVTFRYLLYQNWVFLNVTPELFFEKEKNYSTQNSLTLKLEFLLTE